MNVPTVTAAGVTKATAPTLMVNLLNEAPRVSSHPPRSCLLEVLQQTPTASYRGLLMSLAKHDAINQSVGT